MVEFLNHLKSIYQLSRIGAALGEVAGLSMQITGAITGDADLIVNGSYSFLPSAGYYHLTNPPKFEKNDKIDSELESKLS